jgi:hypothetical protein
MAGLCSYQALFATDKSKGRLLNCFSLDMDIPRWLDGHLDFFLFVLMHGFSV